jgi:hypothetical protein
MKTRQFGILLLAAMAIGIALPASAGASVGWTDKTSSWSGLDSGGALMANGSDLYYFVGASIKKYNSATDTWSALTSAPAGYSGYSTARDPWTNIDNVNGKFYLYYHNTEPGGGAFQVFDPAGNGGAGAWSKVGLPGQDTSWYEQWAQGSVYDTYAGKYWCFWTNLSDSSKYVIGAGWDGSTWTDPASYTGVTSWDPNHSLWSFGNSVTVNNVNYSLTASGQTVTLSTIDFATGTAPEGGTQSSVTYDLGAGNVLSSGEEIARVMLTTLNGKIYIAGAGTSGALLVYDPATGTWTQLESYTDTKGATTNDHSIAATSDGMIYVSDGGQFLVYNTTPEPATMALLAVGGLSMLLRRKRS